MRACCLPLHARLAVPVLSHQQQTRLLQLSQMLKRPLQRLSLALLALQGRLESAPAGPAPEWLQPPRQAQGVR